MRGSGRLKNYSKRLLGPKYTEKLVFLKRFLSSPGSVGSITPSSRFLTRAMLRHIDWNHPQVVAELGAGTGIFTRYLVKHLAKGSKLAVFELDPHMRVLIEKEHADLKVYENAMFIDKALEKEGISSAKDSCDWVVSSLPYAVLPSKVSEAVLAQVVRCLKPEGTFIAYQYSLQMRAKFKECFDEVGISFVLRNVPPAFVYTCRKPRKDAFTGEHDS